MPSSSFHRLPGWLILIAAMTAVGPVSIDMYLPGFPLIQREFAEQGVERTMASYLIGIALGQLVYGPISDRFGRKPPLYFGFALYAIGALGCVLATSMTMLILMRVLQALGACASMVIGRAIVRDRCQPEEAARAFSILMMIISLGPIIAPLLGGWIVTLFGWRAVFVFQSVLGLSLLVAMHRMMTESRDPAHIVPLSFSQVARGYGRLLADRKFMGYSLVGGFCMGTLFCYVAGSPTVMTRLYDLSPQQFGWLIGLNGIAFMIASRLNMILLRRRGPAELLARAVWVPLVVGVIFSGLALSMHLPLWLVIVLQFAFFISVARVSPNVAALALAAHAREAGAASAMMGSVQSALATAAGVAVAIFNDGTILTLALLMTTGATCLWLSYRWVGSEA
jgi:DHA1 family bicyclomycin/chloramphenicol resistance-like MFS transporter